MTWYCRVPGVRVEQIGGGWAAFSPLSGDTLLLNDSSAAVLEYLEAGPADDTSVAAALAGDADVPGETMSQALRSGWEDLVSAGLVRRSAVPVFPSK
jgi:PqqD family protein of HPr-rel-A system